ncbi:MFS transporter [Brevibacterium sp. 50QC2O2]|uniref:MFS transporter n=1 Tax=Brevibacterium TaxID=1696 RepID=UPI00211CD95A|nr:MFS transporter [Brevibacterium sp. 91QC2O2]MCQ9385954.1 MFS transporter [Brevibacterium sp. 68QC2CO]MCQ9387380.1 MFS transporter [Brevibacterium sp. 50QC2O2]
MDRARLWTKDFNLSLVVSLFLSLLFYMLMTSLAGYAAGRFHAGAAVAGLASSAYIVGAVAGRIVVGKYMDFMGRKRLLLIVLASSIVLSLLYIAAGGVWLLILVRLVHGAGYGLGHTVLMTIAQSLIPDSRRGEGTGYFGLATSLATAVGPLCAVAITAAAGYDWLFITSALVSLGGLLALLCMRVPERTPGAEEIAGKWRLSAASIVAPGALPIALVMFLAGMAYSGVLTFLQPFVTAHGMAQAAGWFFFAYACATFAARLTVGRMQDARGDNAVAYPMLLVFAVGLVVLALAHEPWQIVLAGVALGVGFGSVMPIMQTIAVQAVGRAQIGVAMATFFLMLDLGTGIGPLILGWVSGRAGDRAIYVCAAVLIVLALGVYTAVHGRGPGRRTRGSGTAGGGPGA